MVAYNDRLYVTRTGANAGVRYIDILSNGALGNTWSSGPNMNDAAGHSLGGIAFYNGYIYAIGGDSGGANTVEYTHINADGTLDAWTTTTSINTGRAGLSAIAHNGYLYAMGGCTNIGSEANCSATIKNDVQFAKLNSNGSLASDSGCGAVWCFAPNSSGRNEFGLVAAHGYMYAFRPGVGAAIAERAAILSNGNLGIWERTTVNASPRPAAIYAKGSIYLVAGGGISIATNERANLQSISRRGTYSRMFDMDTDVLPTKFLANGSLNSDTKSIVRLDYKLTPTGSSTFGSATTTESYSLDSLISLVASERRYAQATLTLDDGASSIFPDSATTPTTISDLMLFYRPAPAKRLRGGKTFTGEKERGLDAQP
jgi:hypothetical protein